MVRMLQAGRPDSLDKANTEYEKKASPEVTGVEGGKLSRLKDEGIVYIA
jgi:hypothetical protein